MLIINNKSLLLAFTNSQGSVIQSCNHYQILCLEAEESFRGITGNGIFS